MITNLLKPFLLWVICALILSNCTSKKDQRTNNLRAFTKLYGYVKYFHPSDEAAGIDWDKFAIYGANRVQQVKNPEELKSVLYELFLPIAPSIKLYHETDDAQFNVESITPEDTTRFKTISWQHEGLGLRSNSPYTSARINRKVEIKPGLAEWTSFTKRFDATPYRGKEFKLEAFAKAAVERGKGWLNLWLRVDLDNKERGFFENMDQNPITINEWRNYSFSGLIDADADFINFGLFMTGDGNCWVDNYTFSIKTDEGWENIVFDDFEAIEENELPQDWEKGIGKSSRGKGDHHMFSISKDQAYQGRKSLQVRSTTNQWSPPKMLFDKYTVVGEYINKPIGNGLKCMIPLALYGTNEFTYPKSDQKKYDELITTLNDPSLNNFSGNQLEVRLGNIIVMWNIFQHFYAYFDNIDLDWDQALSTAIEDCYEDETEVDFLHTLRKFTAPLNDAHIGITLYGDTTSSYYVPIEWEWIENQLTITNILDENINLEKGDIILEVDDLDAQTVFENIEQYISASHEGRLKIRSQRRALVGSEGSSLKLKVQTKDNEIKDLVLDRNLNSSEYRRLLSMVKNEITHQEIEPGIHYLNIDIISMDAIDELLPQLSTAKGIICDLRGYPNGNHGFISHLLKEPDTSMSWMRVPQIIYPDYENLIGFRNHGWGLPTKEPYLGSKEVVFITNARAISYAESYMGFIENYDLATIVGEPTAGTNGDINIYVLPGGYDVWWTGMLVVKHDGSQHHGVGTTPDIRVNKSIEGLRAGRDEFLEVAIDVIKEKMGDAE